MRFFGFSRPSRKFFSNICLFSGKLLVGYTLFVAIFGGTLFVNEYFVVPPSPEWLYNTILFVGFIFVNFYLGVLGFGVQRMRTWVYPFIMVFFLGTALWVVLMPLVTPWQWFLIVPAVGILVPFYEYFWSFHYLSGPLFPWWSWLFLGPGFVASIVPVFIIYLG